VGPRPPDQALTLGLRIRSTAPKRDLALTVTVFSHVASRSAFDETLNGRGLGAVVTRSPSLPLTSLTTDAPGVTTLTIPVVGDTTPDVPGDWTADLHCVPGDCADVYPLKVTLSDSGSGGGAQLISYLVYDDPASTSQPLRFSLVAPLGLAPPTADGRGQRRLPGAAAEARLSSLVSTISAAPAVPVTLLPDPATLGLLADTGRSRDVAAVAALSSSPARQTVAQTFVPVDAGALVAAGAGGEVGAQVRRGAAVLSALGVHATAGTWVADGPLDQTALDALVPSFDHVVVPQTDVTGPEGPLTTTQPFTLTSEHGAPVTAAVADPGLGAHLSAADGSDPALAAVQLLADLSFIYDEVPNLRGPGGTPAPRGVVAVAPPEWSPSPAFVSAALAGLQGNPVVTPVTLDQLFAQVPVGADGQPDTRRPAALTPAAVPGRALRTARARQLGFDSAVSATARGSDTAQTLGDLLLGAESSVLTDGQQQAAVAGYETALENQLHLLAVRSDTIRLTAGTASVPITVVRNTPYPVTVVVVLTSDKLRFPGAATQSPGASCRAPRVQTEAARSSFSAVCVLDRTTDAVYVNMRARTSGDFRVDVTLASPDGDLALAGGELTVRSSSISAVAIALSATAVVVLAAWWGRTLRRRPRRGAHSRAVARSTA
jgi:hypothetical protein